MQSTHEQGQHLERNATNPAEEASAHLQWHWPRKRLATSQKLVVGRMRRNASLPVSLRSRFLGFPALATPLAPLIGPRCRSALDGSAVRHLVLTCRRGLICRLCRLGSCCWPACCKLLPHRNAGRRRVGQPRRQRSYLPRRLFFCRYQASIQSCYSPHGCERNFGSSSRMLLEVVSQVVSQRLHGFQGKSKGDRAPTRADLDSGLCSPNAAERQPR